MEINPLKVGNSFSLQLGCTLYSNVLGWIYITEYRAVVRVGAEEVLVPPEFGVSEKRTEREVDGQLLSAPTDLKT